MGGYEPNPKPWAVDGLPDNFEFQLLDDDLEHFEPLLELAAGRVPAMQTAGIKQFINGPESFTPDGNFILGEAPEVRGVFVGAGFNAFGIAVGRRRRHGARRMGRQGRAALRSLAGRHPPLRPATISTRAGCARARSRPTPSTTRWPGRSRSIAPGDRFRRSPLYDRLKAQGACFGEKLGWERPNWFADLASGEKAEDIYSYERQNWFDAVGREHTAARERVAVFDQTSFAKFLLVGRDAEQALSWIAPTTSRSRRAISSTRRC